MALESIKEKYPKLTVVDIRELHKQTVDVFSPCALSNCLNKSSVADLKCKVVAGGANNQLEDEDIAEALYKKDILYAPDYVVKAGGLISVYDEYENGNTRVSRVEKRIRIISKNMREVIVQSKEKRKNTTEIADEKARKIFDSLI